MVGETNRLPFDLPEAEGELVGGYTTEYSSMKFAWFFLAEYINMLNVSAVATTLFFGGWRAPFIPADSFLQQGWWPVLWFLAKLWALMFFFVWVRGSVLRFRYDQFMKLGWKVLIPAALVWLVMVTVVQGLRQFPQFADVELRTILFGLAGVVVVGVVISLLIPEKKPTPPPGPAAGARRVRRRLPGAAAARSGAAAVAAPRARHRRCPRRRGHHHERRCADRPEGGARWLSRARSRPPRARRSPPARRRAGRCRTRARQGRRARKPTGEVGAPAVPRTSR